MLQNFLLLDEVSGDSHQKFTAEGNQEELGVSIKDGKAQWSTETSEPTLVDMNLSMRPGQLVAVIGPVGSGKVQFFLNLLIKHIISVFFFCNTFYIATYGIISNYIKHNM
jgi:ABC-type multidrug transport system fused ATPase/permease subunit